MNAAMRDELAPRFPAGVPVRFHVVEAEGRRLEAQPRGGIAVDVSRTGLRLRTDALPEPLQERLAGATTDVTLEMVVTAPGSEHTLAGSVRWGRASDGGCLIGVEYVPADRDRGADLARRYERAFLRPCVVRWASLLATGVAAVALALQLSASLGHRAQIAEAKGALDDTLRRKQELAARLSFLEKQGESSPASEPALTREVDTLRSQLEEVREQVADAEFHARRGRTFFAEGNVAAALREYSEATRLDPAEPEPHLKIAMISELYGFDEAALEAYGRYLRLSPDAPDAYEVERRIVGLFEPAPAGEPEELRVAEELGDADETP